MTTQRSVLVRSLTTQQGSKTPRLVRLRSVAIQPACKTLLAGKVRSLATQVVAATRPAVLPRSGTTPPALATRLKGFAALVSNTIGNNNTAAGDNALFSNTTGSQNTATGFGALFNNTTGGSNIALGINPGTNLTTGSNNIDIGSSGVGGESNKIRIGTKPAQKATFIAGISGVTVANGVGVIINPQGQLGTVVSSERFKDEISPMDKSSEAILSLKPVTFHYKKELDPDAIPQFGLVAEDVANIDPDLVAKDEEGKPYTVRYEAVNAMLLNEFLKEHKKVEEQGHEIAELRAAVSDLRAAIRPKR